MISVKKNSFSFDEVLCSLLKDIVEHIVDFLTDLVNMSFKTGSYSTISKNSIIQSVFKKSDVYNISNYRGITLLSAFLKVSKNAFYNRLASFFNVTVFLVVTFGFHKHKMQ